MKLFQFIVSACCLIFPCCLHSQVIKGRVVDSRNGEHLFAVVVGEKGTGIGSITDFDGEFSIKVEKLPVTLVIGLVGYIQQELTIQTADKFLEIKLVANEQTLSDVEVVSDRILEKQKKSPLTVESMDAIAIKNVPSGNFYEGLAALKGVDMASASLAFRVINTRGFNSTSPVRVLQLIDGVDNQSPGLNFSLGNFLGAPDLDVKSVDVIQGASSAYFGPGAFNGVINIETKNPFLNRGLSACIKVGERNMVQPCFRWADAFNNKDNKPFLAYKLNLLYLKADDWKATNYEPIYGSSNGQSNPGRFDAVNIYGDEFFGLNDFSTDSPFSASSRGLGTFYRTGYREEDLVNYKTENLKINAAVHWRLKPDLDFESPELIAQFNMGKGSTVYQGDNRFSLQDIFFMQNRLELRKHGKYFLRIYATNENAGKSYDPYFTALKLRDEARSQDNWNSVYTKYWQTRIIPRMNALGFPNIVLNPNPVNPPFDYFITPDNATLQAWLQTYQDSLVYWHQLTEGWTNTGNAGLPVVAELGYFAPGTSRFKEAFDRITSAKNNEGEGGTKFYDRSALYNVQGEYKWSFLKLDEIRVGFSGRLYAPNSAGTIFTDTLSRQITQVDATSFDTTYKKNPIFNSQIGVYAGIEKKLLEDKLSLNATLRVDKNQNFDALMSPAISAVFSPKKNQFFRISFSSALRNPTLTDQYLSLNVGPAILRGNLNGVDSLITLDSFTKFRDTQNPNSLSYFNLDPIKPEQARSIEIGYRGTILQNIFLDISAYTTYYQNFIGYKLGIDADFDNNGILYYNSIQAYRYSANSENRVITQGANFGLNYYFHKQHAFNFNYSYNKLAKADESDPIIPAFNTPLHKFNVGFNAHELMVGNNGNTWGYGTNYKWVDKYFWEGSPQFTGPVPAFIVVDAQVNFTWKAAKTNFKIGCSNILNNQHIEAYGGPRIGRLAYLSLLYEWSK